MLQIDFIRLGDGCQVDFFVSFAQQAQISCVLFELRFIQKDPLFGKGLGKLFWIHIVSFHRWLGVFFYLSTLS